MRKIVIASLATLALAGCEGSKPAYVQPTDNAGYAVATLFTHKGITVYRFIDGGKYVYFTGKGDVMAQRTEYCGKGCTRTETTQTLANE